jgi:hypothetical protein
MKKKKSRLQEATDGTQNGMQNIRIQKQVYLFTHSRGRRRYFKLRKKERYCEIRLGHWLNPNTENEEEKLLENEEVGQYISCKILNDTNDVLSYPL